MENWDGIEGRGKDFRAKLRCLYFIWQERNKRVLKRDIYAHNWEILLQKVENMPLGIGWGLSYVSFCLSCTCNARVLVSFLHIISFVRYILFKFHPKNTFFQLDYLACWVLKLLITVASLLPNLVTFLKCTYDEGKFFLTFEIHFCMSYNI